MQDSNADYYEVLHVHPSAHPDVIQAAYRRLALLYHPDRNPSPEATDLMAQLNHAYEILSDPEKRAEYDRSREAQGNTPPTLGETASSGSGRPSSGYSPGTESSRGTGIGFFTLGSTKSDVLRIQGPPTDTSVYQTIGEVWNYGTVDMVEFDPLTGHVQAWSNSSGALRILLIPGPNVTSYDFFTEGDHRDEVARLQGTPAGIAVSQILDEEMWFFGSGDTVEFSFSTGRVTDWENDGGTLKARRAPSDSRVGAVDIGNQRPESTSNVTSNVRGSNVRYFTVGSSKDDVRCLQGQPRSIQRTTMVELWRYGRSWIAFSHGTDLVSNWSNADGTLQVAEPQPSGRTGFRAPGNWRTLSDEFNSQTRDVIIYTVDPIDPDYSLVVRFWHRELNIFVDWDTGISYSDRTPVNWQIDDGPGWQQIWEVNGSNKSWTVLPDTETAETIRALMDAETFSVRVYPFGGNPITASFNVRGFATAVAPILEAWRQAGSPAPGHAARGMGCFLLPVLGLATAAAVAVPVIWFLH